MILLPNDCYCSEIKVIPSNWKKCPQKALQQVWYIYYRFYDPTISKNGKIVPKLVIVKGMNSHNTLEGRREKTKDLIKEQLSLLLNGYNPNAENKDCAVISEKKDDLPPIVKSSQNVPVESLVSLPATRSVPNFKLPDAFDFTADSPFFPTVYKVLEISTYDNEVKICIRSALKYSLLAAKDLGIENIPLNKITPLIILALLAQIRTVKVAVTNRTYNFYRAHLMMVFKCLKDLKILDSNPVEATAALEHQSKKKIVLNDEEREIIDKFLRIHNFRFWLFVNIFFHSGIRRNEIMRVIGQDVDLKSLSLRVNVRKGKSRIVEKPIKAICRTLWEQALEGCDPEMYVFGKRLMPSEKPINPRQITRRWRWWIKKKLGIMVDFYSLKHLNSDEVSARLDISHAAELNSQRSVAVTEIYTVKEQERRKMRIQRMGNTFVPITHQSSDNLEKDRAERVLNLLLSKCMEVCRPEQLNKYYWEAILLNCTLFSLSPILHQWQIQPVEVKQLFAHLVFKNKIIIYTGDIMPSYIPKEYYWTS